MSTSRTLLTITDSLKEYHTLLEHLSKQNKPAVLSGVSSIHRVLLAASMNKNTGRPVVLVCSNETDAKSLSQDFCALTGEETPILISRDYILHTGSVSKHTDHSRLSVFFDLIHSRCQLLIATADGLLQRTIPPEYFDQYSLSVSPGDIISLTQLEEKLTSAGYTRCQQVEGIGQYAVRGDILDIFSPGLDLPVRIEFWGDEIDTISLFDPITQRRTGQQNHCSILPSRELIGATSDPTDLSLPQLYPSYSSAMDYLPEDCILLLCDTPQVIESLNQFKKNIENSLKTLQDQGVIKKSSNYLLCGGAEQLCNPGQKRNLLYLDTFLSGSFPVPPSALFSLSARQLPGYGIHFSALEEDLVTYQKENYSVVILTSTRRKADNLQELLREHAISSAVDELLHELPSPGQIFITVGDLSCGFEFPDAKIAVLAESRKTLPTAKKTPRHASSGSNRQKLISFTDLSPGDLVVHEEHGIGRFVNMEKIRTDGIERDYLKLEFAGSDILYVPAIQLDLISKYIGSGDSPEHRQLSKLNGDRWKQTKRKAKKAAKDMAKGLIKLYAQRQRQPGYAFSTDSPWQLEFESQFPYAETDDQLRCTEEIKRDMERPTPMDRLLCGDVGYGKTEVAFRAVMKCVLDGKQAAVLVPTTVLARQHYITALDRFSSYPVNIRLLSRFSTTSEEKSILQETESGKVDVLIGTHKLLNKNLKFKDLGLLVVDEEQRFGVIHKEKLKEISKQVDVLTLSATPIPRTLNMAMSGIRDMSVLESPPVNRQPVRTCVVEHDWGILTTAIRRELDRGGQVYYLHNRTETIARTALKLKALLGEDIRIATAHGKMDAHQLSDTMNQMAEGSIDILVCTTIIETGVDIPNVNTLIIEDADRMGLSQLHQLRGRVGRSSRRATAYLTYQKQKVLTEEQTKRLSAIREYATFGAGFKIAMRDMEIRGAGNLLGPEQSGFLISVGYDLYLQLLEEAILEEQGKPVTRPTECLVDLPIPASIPNRFISAAELRMDLYRRIARIRTKEEGEDMMDEIIDRFGDPPIGVANLIEISLLRTLAASAGISEISQKDLLLSLTLPNANLSAISSLCVNSKYSRKLMFSPGKKNVLSLRMKKGDSSISCARDLITDYKENLQLEAETSDSSPS